MRDGAKVIEILIGSLLTAICTISAYYLHSVNESLIEVKQLWQLGNYRIEQLERKIETMQSDIADLRRSYRRP